MCASLQEALRVWLSERDLLITLTFMVSYFSVSRTLRSAARNLPELVPCASSSITNGGPLLLADILSCDPASLFDWPLAYWHMWLSQFWGYTHVFSESTDKEHLDHDDTLKPLPLKHTTRWIRCCLCKAAFFYVKLIKCQIYEGFFAPGSWICC